MTNYGYNEFEEDKKEILDDTPSPKQTKIGVWMGIGYLTLFSYIPYIILSIFWVATTATQDNIQSTIAQLISGGVCLGVMIHACKDKLKFMAKGFRPETVLTCIGFAVAAYVLVIVLSVMDMSLFGESETNANQQSINELYEQAPILAILLTCVLAPLIEEAIFRYFIFKPIAKHNVVLGFIVSAVTFGLIHMLSTFLEFMDTHDTAVLFNDLRSLVIYVACGCVFTYAYHKTKMLICPILAHCFYNSFATLIALSALTSIPAKITNIETYDNGFNFQIELNDTYTDISIDNITIYYSKYEDDIENNKLDYYLRDEVYYVENLESRNKVYINVEYSYYATTNDTEKTKEEVITYVYTIQSR